jgi:hypothetical protein
MDGFILKPQGGFIILLIEGIKNGVYGNSENCISLWPKAT